MAGKATHESKNGNGNGTHAAFAGVAREGAERVKAGFEKAAKGYEQFAQFGRENFDAILKSANVTTKGLENLQAEVTAFHKQSVEDTVAATKAIFAAKTVHEAFEVQADFTKSAFDAYVQQMNRMSDIWLATAKDAAEPLTARLNAFVTIAQNGAKAD